jgi:hypothetical protein
VIIKPNDYKTDSALKYTFITHAENNGMSVLREGASDREFSETINLRLTRSKPGAEFEGVLTFRCKDVRGLVAQQTAPGRVKGDRLYYVLDTDIEGRPHHADVFATVPRWRHSEKISARAVWRQQRSELMELLREAPEGPDTFREGRLLKPAGE